MNCCEDAREPASVAVLQQEPDSSRREVPAAQDNQQVRPLVTIRWP